MGRGFYRIWRSIYIYIYNYKKSIETEVNNEETRRDEKRREEKRREEYLSVSSTP